MLCYAMLCYAMLSYQNPMHLHTRPDPVRPFGEIEMGIEKERDERGGRKWVYILFTGSEEKEIEKEKRRAECKVKSKK